MSASSNPTFRPLLARATARFTATVDFPTPPLPLITTILCFTDARFSLTATAPPTPVLASPMAGPLLPASALISSARQLGCRTLLGQLDAVPRQEYLRLDAQGTGSARACEGHCRLLNVLVPVSAYHNERLVRVTF